MRPIKFRAWIRDGEWEEDGSQQKYVMCYDLAFEDFEPINDLLEKVENLMQFTGLLDKAGKEIYEGDIVKDSENKLLAIKWDMHNVAFVAGNRWMEWLRGYGNAGNPFSAGACEIVGNIYESPELVKKSHAATDKG